MRPIRTPRTNRTFKLPGGTEANDLPLEATTDGGDPDEAPVLVSTWELTDEERQWVAEGGHVVLTVWGLGTPPVALHVEKDGDILGTAGDAELENTIKLIEGGRPLAGDERTDRALAFIRRGG